VSVERSRTRALLIAPALLGAALSGALEWVHYRAHARAASSSFCSFGEQLDCASVALSSYSVWLGVPVPLWGLLGFCSIGIAAWRLSSWLMPLTLLATLASIGLLLVELLRIGAVCLLCEGVHASSLALLLVAWRAKRAGVLTVFRAADALYALAPAVGLWLALRLFLPPYWGVFGWREVIPYAQGTTPEGDAWLGAAEPKLSVLEFVDYSCPHCKAASARTLRALARHPGELRVMRAYFPRSPCDEQTAANCLPARVAACAGEQGKFWQADRYLFEHVRWDRELDRMRVVDELMLERERFMACLDRPDVVARAAAAWKRAKKLRLPGTPYYVVDGKRLSEAEVARLIQSL
jgi:uncharacterized membrane protein